MPMIPAYTPKNQSDNASSSGHTRRSPRRRQGVGGRISISRKLFAYLALFTLFILAVVWIMQIGLLNYFYSQSKYDELVLSDRLVTETDSPYLAPVPFRGKRNETSYVKRVAVKLAELYETEIGTVEQQTAANALKVFKIPV